MERKEKEKTKTRQKEEISAQVGHGISVYLS